MKLEPGSFYVLTQGCVGVCLVGISTLLVDIAEEVDSTSLKLWPAFVCRTIGEVLATLISPDILRQAMSIHYYWADAALVLGLGLLSCLWLLLSFISSYYVLCVWFFASGVLSALLDTGLQIQTRDIYAAEAGPWLRANSVAFAVGGVVAPLPSYFNVGLKLETAFYSAIAVCSGLWGCLVIIQGRGYQPEKRLANEGEHSDSSGVAMAPRTTKAGVGSDYGGGRCTPAIIGTTTFATAILPSKGTARSESSDPLSVHLLGGGEVRDHNGSCVGSTATTPPLSDDVEYYANVAVEEEWSKDRSTRGAQKHEEENQPCFSTTTDPAVTDSRCGGGDGTGGERRFMALARMLFTVSFYREYRSEVLLGLILLVHVGATDGVSYYLITYVNDTGIIAQDNGSLMLAMFWLCNCITALISAFGGKIPIYSLYRRLSFFPLACIVCMIPLLVAGIVSAYPSWLGWICFLAFPAMSGPYIGYALNQSHEICARSMEASAIPILCLNVGSSIVPSIMAVVWDYGIGPLALPLVTIVADVVVVGINLSLPRLNKVLWEAIAVAERQESKVEVAAVDELACP